MEGSGLDPDAPTAVAAGMLGVAAMAVQNALVQISLSGSPASTEMTTDITAFVMDVGTILLWRDPNGVAFARARARRSWRPIVGLIVGCSLGALLQAAMGPWSLALPTGFACLARALGALGAPQPWRI